MSHFQWWEAVGVFSSNFDPQGNKWGTFWLQGKLDWERENTIGKGSFLSDLVRLKQFVQHFLWFVIFWKAKERNGQCVHCSARTWSSGSAVERQQMLQRDHCESQFLSHSIMQLLTATTGALMDFEQIQQILEIQVQTELHLLSPTPPPKKKKKKGNWERNK